LNFGDVSGFRDAMAPKRFQLRADLWPIRIVSSNFRATGAADKKRGV
jgi:hypothetical protein